MQAPSHSSDCNYDRPRAARCPDRVKQFSLWSVKADESGIFVKPTTITALADPYGLDCADHI